jgi:hypothetical protein
MGNGCYPQRLNSRRRPQLSDNQISDMDTPTVGGARPDTLGRTAQPKPALQTTAGAAKTLGVRPATLRARCRAAATYAGPYAVALLEGRVVAFKFGPRWRLRLGLAFP